MPAPRIVTGGRISTARAGERPRIVRSPPPRVGPAWGPSPVVRKLPQSLGATIATVGLALSSLVDSFDDNTVDTALWPNSFGAYSETGGRARITCDTGYNAYSSWLAYTLHESGMFLRAYPPAAGGATTEAWAQVLIKQQTAGTDIGFEISPLSGNLTMFSRVGFFDAGAVAVTYDATAHAWLQIRETGGTVYWETSPDGHTWTTRRTLTSPTWVGDPNLEFQLISHRSDGVNDYAEYDSLNVAPPVTAALGTASETDSGQTLPPSKRAALGISSGTETVQVLGRTKRITLGTALETSTGQTIGRMKSRTAGIAGEAGSGQAVSRTKSRTLSLASQIEAAQQPGRTKTRSTAPASSTETAQAATSTKRPTAGVASEAETAQALTAHRTAALGTAVESDAGVATAAHKKVTAATASQADAAVPLAKTKSRTLGQAVETSTAQTAGRLKSRAVGASTGIDAAQDMARSKRASVASASAGETSQGLIGAKTAAIASAADGEAAQDAHTAKTAPALCTVAVEAAQALHAAKTAYAGPALTQDGAQPLTAVKRHPVVAAAEICTVQQISVAGGVQPATDIGAARPLAALKQLTLGIAQESSQAVVPAAGKHAAVALAIGAETAQALGVAKRATLATAGETAQAVTLREAQLHQLPATQSTEAAQPLMPVKRRHLGTAAGTCTAGQLAVRKTRMLVPAAGTDTAVALIRGPLVEDVDVTVGAPYSPWAASSPHAAPYGVGAASDAWRPGALYGTPVTTAVPVEGWEVAAPC